MSETYSVSLNVQLPRDIALQAEELQRSNPEYLSQVVVYGLARRSMYHELREEQPRPAGALGDDLRR